MDDEQKLMKDKIPIRERYGLGFSEERDHPDYHKSIH